MKKIGAVFFILTLLANPCLASVETSSQEQTSFSSYPEAQRYIQEHYESESVDTSKSSWMTSAEYYYAGGEGYLILGMNGKPYIFKGVPVDVWEGFKAAESFGRYYHSYIKGRYYFHLNQ